MEKLNLIFYQFDRETPFVDIISKDLEKKGDFEISFVNDYSELGQMTSDLDSMIVIFRLIENHDLAQTVGTLQATKQKYKDGLFRAICIQQKPAQRKVERLLRNLGCNEFFDTNTNPRTMRFKIDFLGRGIQAAIKQKEQAEKHRDRGSANSRTEEKAENQVKVSFISPLKIESDIWILKAEEDYKKVLGKWLFQLIGPSSRVGAWEYIESRDTTINGCYKFVIDHEFMGKFITEEGAWYFKGNRPEFDWKTSRWKFSSAEPKLFFRPKGEDPLYKIQLNELNLFISKNSDAAMLKEKEILETCDGRFAVNKDKPEESEGMSYMDRMAKEKEGRLEGKGSSEETDGHLKGKNSQEDASNNLKGKLDNSSKDNEDQKDQKERQGFKEESSNDLSGKNGKSEATDGHLKGGVKKTEAEVQEEKERQGFKEESSNDLSGKNGKSEAIDGHLKGGVKKDEASDEIDSEINQEMQDSKAAGNDSKDSKTEAQDLENKLKKDEFKDGALSGNIKDKEKTAKDLDGKNKTDKIDSHLRSDQQKDGIEENVNKDKAFAKNDNQGRELEITEDGAGAGEINGKHKSDKAHDGALAGSIKDKEQAAKNLEKKQQADEIYEDLKDKANPNEYNADSESKDSNPDFIDKNEFSENRNNNTEDFRDKAKQGEIKDNAHSLSRDKVSGQLKGSITPTKEEPVNLESGKIESFIKIDNKKIEAEFQDILEEELYLQINKGIVRNDQLVEFSISFNYGAEEARLTGQGIVGEIEDDEGFDFVIIDIQNVKLAELKAFLNLYGKRQESINQFLNLAKGA